MKYPSTNRPEVAGWYWVKDHYTGETRLGWHAVEVFDDVSGNWRVRVGPMNSHEIDGTETFYGPIELPDEARPFGVRVQTDQVLRLMERLGHI